MRILFVTHSFPRFSGDVAGAFILRLAKALEDGGATIEVLAPSAPRLANVDTIEGVQLRRFRYAPKTWETLAYTGTMAEQVGESFRGKAALAGMLSRGALAVRSAAAEFNPDVIHSHWWFPAGLLTQASLSSRPRVTTLHGSDVRLAKRTAWAPLLFRRVALRSAAVTAVSSYLASEAKSMLPNLDVEVEPMPVNVDLFTRPASARSTDRFLFVGRLNAQKGIALLLEALAQTQAGASLDIVGDGDDHGALKKRAADLGIPDRVRWLGALSQEKLVPLYHAAAAVVIPSENEGLGLVAVEAQLCEAPVIAFRSGGLSDVITDGATGLLTPAGGIRELAAAMDGILARDDRGASLGKAGRAAALVRFSPSVVAAHYAAIYERASAKVDTATGR